MAERSAAIGTLLDTDHGLDLYRHMVTARAVDALEERIVNRGLASFHVSGAGHEAVAAIARHLRPEDWLHLHYRDKALMIARGMPVRMFFDSLFCSDASPSRGRQMSAHASWRSGRVLSLCGPVGNNALQAVGIAAEIAREEGEAVVLCCLGDGTTQQGEVMEAFAEAVRSALPVIFLVEDNALAISTATRGKTFFSLPAFDPTDFMGMPIQAMDGTDPDACDRIFVRVVRDTRRRRGPALIVMDVERLANHTHADDQRQYRPAAAMAALPDRDPIAGMRRRLMKRGVAETRLRRIEEEASEAVEAAARSSEARRPPVAQMSAKRALPPRPRSDVAAKVDETVDETLAMGAAIADVLRRRLRTDPRVTLFGQDIEDPKGDVFGVTRGLSTEFGRRVANAPLSESTIVGTAIGRALAGGRPVAFLQFADFLPLAFNQIVSELATMHWRTDGEWDCPVVVMAPSGGYRQGLGPFHAQSFEAIACHTPGLDVLYPSNAADAFGLLDAALDSGRPTLFCYPKALLNDAGVALASGSVLPCVEIGKAATVRGGTDITFVSYGNGVKLCATAADWLAGIGLAAEILDLRSLSPLDADAVLASARKTGRLVVVHEDVGTCGIGAEIVARVAESAAGIAVARVCRAETFVPCHFGNQLAVLPSSRDVLDAAARLLDLEVAWRAPPIADDVVLVRAVGSPSDESVTMIECRVTAGDTIRAGDCLATFETVKAAIEYEAPIGGVVQSVLATAGDVIKVGDPFLSIAAPTVALEDGLDESRLVPTLSFRSAPRPYKGQSLVSRDTRAGILSIATRLGSTKVSNAVEAERHRGRSARDVERLTGIATRWRVAPGETAVTLGAAAARDALEAASLAIEDIDAIVCATGTPGPTTPSLACRILHALAGERSACQAHDVSAACSGYLYALQNAHDLIGAAPAARVLVITAEVLSPLVDEDDFETGLIFSDGASATILAASHDVRAKLLLSRPVLSASGEPGAALAVPASRSDGAIAMDGGKVFTSAVRAMADMLLRACAAEGCAIGDLACVIPHQANQRILDAVAGRLGLPLDRVVSNIRDRGNTSSSSIPICLGERQPMLRSGQRIGLTAFGGGFTAGAALLTVR